MAENLSGPDRQLEIRTERAGDAYVVRLVGELDLAGADLTDQALIAAEDSDAGRILVDIDELEFIDSHGLRTLLRAQRRDEESGRARLRVTRGTGHVAELLRLTAMDQSLPFA
ncbi:MAG TPA: STAS domain-containing protein [Solirubrobacterales bacterium]|nr:STAS domain-containing protein [Solirubrobacterales bacterium]